jgi:hypothetical protein
MTAISLGQAARLSRPGRTAITAAKLGLFSTGNSKSSIDPAQHQQFEMHIGDVASPSQDLASGFVDFLLGRSARQR